MRNSSERTLIWGTVIALIVGLLSLYFFQGVWLKAIEYMLAKSGESAAFPASTPIAGMSFATAPAPVGANVEVVHGSVAISVTRAVHPANLMGGSQLTSIKSGQDYLLVDIKVRCLSTDETCYISETDFAVHGTGGKDYSAELSGFYDLAGMFEGGGLEPGKSRSGTLIFVVDSNERGLVLSYPRMFAFGGSAQFLLTR
jgi:hypothetical protein